MYISKGFLKGCTVKFLFGSTFLMACLVGTIIFNNKCNALPTEKKSNALSVKFLKDKYFVIIKHTEENSDDKRNKRCFALVVNKNMINVASLQGAYAEIINVKSNEKYFFKNGEGLKLQDESIIINLPNDNDYDDKVDYQITFKGIKTLEGKDFEICKTVSVCNFIRPVKECPIKSEYYKMDYENMIIKGVQTSTTALNFARRLLFKDYKVIVRNSMGTSVKNNNIIGTGYTVEFVRDNKIDFKFQIAVTGDLTGKGHITKKGIGILRAHLLGKVKLNKLFLCAADMNGDGKVDSLDIQIMEKYFPCPFE